MGLSSRTASGKAVGMTWQRARSRSEERAARMLQAAERDAEAAAARYRALREAAVAPAPAQGEGSRRPMPTWQQLFLLVVGGGLLAGLLIMWLLATAYVGPAALLVLPASAGLAAGFVALRKRRPEARARHRRPLVADLVRAAQEMHEAEAALQRLRDESQT